MAKGKKYQDATKRYDREMLMDPQAAISPAKSLSEGAGRKFDETVELVALRGGTGRPDIADLPTLFDRRLADLAGDQRAQCRPDLGDADTEVRCERAVDLDGDGRAGRLRTGIPVDDTRDCADQCDRLAGQPFQLPLVGPLSSPPPTPAASVVSVKVPLPWLR